MRRLAALIAFAALAGAAPASAAPPQAVVGVVDSGINAYHQVFRDDSRLAQRHPATWLAGYPKDAEPLRLTLDAKDWRAAVKADCAVWKAVKPGRLYWIPGTKIIGAVSFVTAPEIDCTSDPVVIPRILDTDGHGTMTASRAAAAARWGACPDCRVVSVHAMNSIPLTAPTLETYRQSLKFIADNAGWIDVSSNSWGPFTPAYEPTGSAEGFAGSPAVTRAVAASVKRLPTVFASGNGALFRFGVLGHPTTGNSHAGPQVLQVGGHDSGYVSTWTGFPAHVVSDACASWAAKPLHRSESAEDVGSGTSAAAPFVSGILAAIALDARRILGDRRTGVRSGTVARGPAGRVPAGPLADGRLTRDELERVVTRTAQDRPTAQFEDGPPCRTTGIYDATPVLWKDVPPGYPEEETIGFGAVDRISQTLAGRVLRGQVPLPERPDAEAVFTRYRSVQDAAAGVYSEGRQDPVAPDDADTPAPEDPEDAPATQPKPEKKPAKKKKKRKPKKKRSGR